MILCAFMLEVQTQMQEKMNENRLKQEVQDQAMRDAVKNHHEEKSNEAFEKALHSEQYVPYPQYPWDASQFDGHQDHILENMRNNMFLEVKENSLPFMLATQASQQDVLLSHREQLLAHNPMNLKDIDLDSVSELDSETTTEREYDLKVQEMLSSSASIRNRFGDKFNLNVRLPSSVYSEKNKQELRQGKGKNGRQNRSSGSGSGGGDGVRSQQDSNSNGRDSGAGSTSSDGNGNGIGSPTNTLEPFTDLSQIDRLLEGICFVLPSGCVTCGFNGQHNRPLFTCILCIAFHIFSNSSPLFSPFLSSLLLSSPLLSSLISLYFHYSTIPDTGATSFVQVGPYVSTM